MSRRFDFAPPPEPVVEFDDTEFTGIDLPLPAGGMELRDYQNDALNKIEAGWADASRQLAVLATGAGKTILFSHIAHREVRKGGRVLILAHTEELIGQAADKLFRSTGLESDREKAGDRASLDAKVVIASVQTLAKTDRLMGFPDDHFTLVIVDEAHHSLAISYLRILNYFHHGEASLDDIWEAPAPGVSYKHKAKVLGVTATGDRGDKKNLGQFYQAVPFEYDMLQACRDGNLVRPVLKNLPLKIDLRAMTKRASGGGAFNDAELEARLTPLLREIARQVAIEARSRKTMIFMPSIDSAHRLADALLQEGMNAMWVSGACPDREEKIAEFRAAEPGSVMANAMLLTEGVDIPDVDTVACLRPTTIRSLVVQIYGRASRPLPGVIDGLNTAAERRAAIKASRKPIMLILDFLWLTDRHNLVKAVELVCTKPNIVDRMAATAAETPEVDLLDLEMGATRDLMESLEKAAMKHANKAARVIDPLKWAADLGDGELATYEPKTAWESLEPKPGQLKFLKQQHIDPDQVKSRGFAQQLIVKHLARLKSHMASPAQVQLMLNLHIDQTTAAGLTADQASAAITAAIKLRDERRAAERALRANSTAP